MGAVMSTCIEHELKRFAEVWVVNCGPIQLHHTLPDWLERHRHGAW